MKHVIVSSILFVMSLAAPAWAQKVQVVNAASFQFGFPVAPGSYVQVYGELSQPVTNSSADLSRLPLPTVLGGIQVLVAGVPAPLYTVENDKFNNVDVIACLIPQATQAGHATVQVVQGGTVLGEGAVDVLAKAPGIFWAAGSDGQPAGGVRNQAFEYTTEVPAHRGETIQIALTGQGVELTGQVEDGQAPSQLIETREKPKVYLAVDEAPVQFSGLMPLFPGLWQVNVQIPDSPYISGRVPLFLTYGGVSSNLVYIRVVD